MIQNEYRYNRLFREYVDKYCREKGCTVGKALTHRQVRAAYLHYTET